MQDPPTRDPSDPKYPCNTVFDLGDIDSGFYQNPLEVLALRWDTDTVAHRNYIHP